MRYDPGYGWRSESDRQNDGFLDHAARRGAETGRGCFSWIVGIIFWMMVAGVLLHAVHAL